MQHVQHPVATQFKLPEPAEHASIQLGGGPPVVPPPPVAMALGGSGGDTQVDPATQLADVNWVRVLGGYAGALVLGAGVGWVAGGKRGVYPGVATTSCVWSVGETLWYARRRSWWISTLFLALAIPSGVVAYKHRNTR